MSVDSRCRDPDGR
jgi:hypothetical protein